MFFVVFAFFYRLWDTVVVALLLSWLLVFWFCLFVDTLACMMNAGSACD